MDKKKKIIIMISILTLILIAFSICIVILAVNNNVKNDEEINTVREEQEEYVNTIQNPGQIINGQKPQELKFENLYFTIDNCINEYLNYMNNHNNIIYKLLDEEYIKENSITEENVFNKIEEYGDYYRTIKMYTITGDKYSTYYVYGKTSSKDVYLIVNTDDENKAFSIFPIDKENFNEKIDEVIQTSEKYEKTIQNNTYNTLNYQYFSEQDIVEKYFQDYLNNMVYNIERAYEFLDDEYRQKRFNNIENFINYINLNQNKILSMCKKARKNYTEFNSYEEYEEYYRTVSNIGLSKYSINETNNGKEYICIDTYGNNYIFNVSSVMQYTVILDTYTLELPEFIEKYDAGNDETKLTLNVGKIIEAINNKDYEYVYNKMNETFRNNNFSNISTLEQFINNHFYNINEVQDFSYRQEGNVYICTLGLTDKESTSETIKSVTILLELQDNRNFEISFSM